MSNKTLIYISGFMVAAMFILMLTNMWPSLKTIESQKYLTYDGVNGSAVLHNNKEWNLNFKQQNDLITLLNKGKTIGHELFERDSSLFDFTAIKVYQFDHPTITITPINKSGNNLILSVPQWNENGYIQDTSNGKLSELISETYDK